MKVLYIHSKNLKIDVGGNRRPKKMREFARRIERKQGLKLEPITGENKVASSPNALLAFVCVEAGDEKLGLAPVIESILDARVLVGAKDIVVGAFGHLTTKPAEPGFAKILSEVLAYKVKKEYPNTQTYPFGWDKAVELSIPCHPMNMSFKSFEPQ